MPDRLYRGLKGWPVGCTGDATGDHPGSVFCTYIGVERHHDFTQGQSPFSQVSSQIMFLVLGDRDGELYYARIPVGYC